MNWYFIRHGQIASNLGKVYSGRSDEPLTAAGREQVRRAAHEIAPIGFDAVYSSPLLRARQTARILVDESGLDLGIRIDDSFNELKMGPWEGMSEAEVSRQYPSEWALWNASPADLAIDGRETLAQLQARVLDGMRKIEAEQDCECLLVVTHVAVIRTMLLGTSRQELNRYKSIAVDNARLFKYEKPIV